MDWLIYINDNYKEPKESGVKKWVINAVSDKGAKYDLSSDLNLSPLYTISVNAGKDSK